jgi:DNA-directed RNA polymerase II subunit RPB1
MADYSKIDKIAAIQFGIFSPEEIRRRSVAEIFTQETYEGDNPKIGGIFDPRMGVLDYGKLCPTDELDSRSCPGYFGHLELAQPVFYYHFIKYILKTTRCFCVRCSKLLIKPEDSQISGYIQNQKGLQRFDNIYKVCKTVRFCGQHNEDGCGAEQPTNIKKDSQTIGQFLLEYKKKGEAVKQIKWIAADVLKMFKRITDDECNIVGFNSKFCRPDWMICQVLPISPPAIRPSVMSDNGSRMEDDLTYKLCDIIKTNRSLKQKMNNEGTKQSTIDDWYQLLQYHVATLINNSIPGIPPATQRSGRPLKSIQERLKAKTGRVRGNLMGKRVDFSSRSVITPDSNINIAQLGVPIKIANVLTKPEVVNKYNIEKLTRCVRNGYGGNSKNLWKNYPGAKTYRRKSDGKLISLKVILDASREEIELEYGDIVNRHLMDGDIVLFNRQPSLHKMSMQAHIVKVLDYDTFRLNVQVTKPYNADFDKSLSETGGLKRV